MTNITPADIDASYARIQAVVEAERKAMQSALFPVTAPVKPTMVFDVVPASGTVPLQVTATYSGVGADRVSWDFGELSSSIDTDNPETHVYRTPGTYVVTCTASNAAGDSIGTTAVKVQEVIVPPPVGDMAFEDDFSVTFDDPITGSLNPATWTVVRLGQRTNPNGAGKNTFLSVNAMHCKLPVSGVLPPHDVFNCGPEFGEDMHMMSCLCTPQDDYALVDMIIRQPFQFAQDGSPWILKFGVDAVTLGEHDAWPEVWLTSTLCPGAHGEHPAFRPFPVHGIGITINSGAGQGAIAGSANGISAINVFQNGVPVKAVRGTVPGNGKFLTQTDTPNMFQIKVFPSTNSIEVWATDAGKEAESDFRLVAQATVATGLPLSRGFVHLQQAHYGPAKDATDAAGRALGDRTYHWHEVCFTGEVLPIASLTSYPMHMAIFPSSALPSGWQDRTALDLGYHTATTGRTFQFAGRSAPCRLIFNAFPTDTQPWTINCNGATIVVPAPVGGYAWVVVDVALPAAPSGYTLVFKPTSTMVVSSLYLL